MSTVITDTYEVTLFSAPGAETVLQVFDKVKYDQIIATILTIDQLIALRNMFNQAIENQRPIISVVESSTWIEP